MSTRVCAMPGCDTTAGCQCDRRYSKVILSVTSGDALIEAVHLMLVDRIYLTRTTCSICLKAARHIVDRLRKSGMSDELIRRALTV